MIRSMARCLSAAVLLAALAGPASAQDATPPAPSAEEAQKMAVEGLKQLMQALDLFVKSVPRYSSPEVLPNGDIIIRRLHPEDAPPKPPSPAPDETHT
jgi:hypothetical protein